MSEETPGQRLRRRRMEAGLQQADLAAKVQVSQSTISRWENDDDRPGSEHRFILHGLLDLDPKTAWPNLPRKMPERQRRTSRRRPRVATS